MHHAFIVMLKIIGTTWGLCMFRNLIKMQKDIVDAHINKFNKAFTGYDNPSIKADGRCVINWLQATASFFSLIWVVVKGELFSDFRLSCQFEALLLQVTTHDPATNTHKCKTPGVFFCPISSEVVSLEQMLRGSTVCLPLPHSSSLVLFTSHRTSEAQTIQGWRSFSHTHTHTLLPVTALLINISHSNTDSFLFLSSSPLFSFSAPFACSGRLIIVRFMLGQDRGRRPGWLIFLGNTLALWRPCPSWRYLYLLLMIHLVLLY